MSCNSSHTMGMRLRVATVLVALSIPHLTFAVDIRPPGGDTPAPEPLPTSEVDVPRDALGTPHGPAVDQQDIGVTVQDVRNISGFNPLDDAVLRQQFNPGGTSAVAAGGSASAGPSSPWVNNPGTYTAGGVCGIVSTVLTLVGTNCRLAPLGVNGAVFFDCSAATSSVVSPLTILGSGGENCQLFRTNDKNFGLVCSNPCSDTFTRP